MEGVESSHRITTVVLQMLIELFNMGNMVGISDRVEVKFSFLSIGQLDFFSDGDNSQHCSLFIGNVVED